MVKNFLDLGVLHDPPELLGSGAPGVPAPKLDEKLPGHGDAPVDGPDETEASGGDHVHHQHVEDDPLGGVPVEVASAADEEPQ